MKSAHYGRMRTGRCLITNYQVGCSADVLPHVDGRCSGHRRCTVTVPDSELFSVQPCRKDLVAYFEASYTCVEVSRQSGGCGHPVYLTESARFIPSSLITASIDDESDRCHWLLAVAKGQRIRLTVFDFALWKGNVGDSWKTTDACPVYAMLKESSGVRRVSLCGRGRRERIVYNSSTQYLQVAIVGRRDHNVNFMFKFEGGRVLMTSSYREGASSSIQNCPSSNL
ncbi:hypothetical protein NP493_62g04026 [Ridgeia piscesae]|uniref:CUB domain-containing protein n=1 Tax=Ridgeia piscesae TaxID=27915 RepID=A0AAD9PA93_RIDPI|nr:hypothetical protein NP493_62g04026 [Ridgeia piscesae]